MTQRDMLIKKLATYDFVVVELRLYLDTHPWDTSAKKKMQEFEEKSRALREEYEANFGPICNMCSGSAHAWVKGPWPWEDQL